MANSIKAKNIAEPERLAKYADLMAQPKAADIAHTSETIRADFLGGYTNPNTQLAYKRALDEFEGFFAFFDIDLFELDRNKLQAYLQYLKDGGAHGRPGGPQKINQAFAAIRGFYARAMLYASSTGVLMNPASAVELPPLAKRTASKGLTVSQADRLLRAAARMKNKSIALKAVAVIEILLTSGIRVAELATAAVNGLDTSEPWAWLEVVRKGGAEDRVSLPPRATDALGDYLDGRRDGTLIQSLRGGPESVQGLERLLLYVCAEGELWDFADRLYPHNLRVAFASFCHAAGIDEMEIMDMMGHAKLDTTRRYIVLSKRVSEEDALRILGRA